MFYVGGRLDCIIVDSFNSMGFVGGIAELGVGIRTNQELW